MTQTRNEPPRRLPVTLEGRGKLILTEEHYRATGGEGHVYRSGDTVVKIYHDPGKMIRERIPEKLKVLATIRHPFIVSPEGVVTDRVGSPIGLYMGAAEGEPFTRVFTNSFRNQHGFGDGDATRLVAGMREVVQTAHSHQALMVDPNEMNWFAVLRGAGGPEPRAIDVDSWAIGPWPPRAVMLSVRDWHARGFTELSDWFSWGIVSFQVYTGVHPYHGGLPEYRKGELERRMRENASVFHPDIRLNRAVRDFGCIPPKLLEWYEATFQQGERVIPPSPYDTGGRTPKAALTKRVLVGQTGHVIHDVLYRGADPAIRVFPKGAILLRSGRLITAWDGSTIADSVPGEAEVVRSGDGWLIGEPGPGGVDLRFVSEESEEKLATPVRARDVFRSGNRLFLIGERGITEIRATQMGRAIITAGKTWGAMPNATTWFDGLGIQDAFGATYLILPFGEKSCAQIRVRELDGKRVVGGQAGERFATVIAINKNGAYRKYEYSFDEHYGNHSLWEGEAEQAELNVAILPKGVCATIVTDGELTVFVPRNGTMRQVKDGGVSTDMLLSRIGDTVVYLRKGAVWKMRLK